MTKKSFDEIWNGSLKNTISVGGLQNVSDINGNNALTNLPLSIKNQFSGSIAEAKAGPLNSLDRTNHSSFPSVYYEQLLWPRYYDDVTDETYFDPVTKEELQNPSLLGRNNGIKSQEELKDLITWAQFEKIRDSLPSYEGSRVKLSSALAGVSPEQYRRVLEYISRNRGR